MPSLAEISTRQTKAAEKRNVLLHINEAEARFTDKAKVLDELKIWLKEEADKDAAV
jgi:hypothetical protein